MPRKFNTYTRRHALVHRIGKKHSALFSRSHDDPGDAPIYRIER